MLELDFSLENGKIHAMNSFWTKIRWTFSYFVRNLKELFQDLFDYYLTPYPILLIIGPFKRIRRRFRIIWLAKPKGRPPTHENVVDLIIDMKRCNKIWGAQRISDELKLMGVLVSKKTVLKILKENGFELPKTRFVPPSWKSFLRPYIRYWSMDFTTVFDINGIQIFIFSIIEVPTRKLISINATSNPTSVWLTQQFRNCSILGHTFPSTIVHDRDGIYGHWLPETLTQFGSKSTKTDPYSPWQNGFIERFNLSIKTEMLNRIVLLDEMHVKDLCLSYQKFFNKKRPHQGIDGRIPDKSEAEINTFDSFDRLKVKKTLKLDGLVTHFSLAA